MMMGEEQRNRLMELLRKLADKEAGTIVPSRYPFAPVDFGGQEHRDTQTLAHMGWVRSRRGFFTDIGNSWSAEGIYAFELTDDGRAALADWEARTIAEVVSDESAEASSGRDRPLVMMIHGSKDDQVPPVVEEIRMWCFENGLAAFKAADLPNAGRFVNVKVGETIADADYYVVVLTADEELASGKFHARQNTMMEMGRVLDRNPSKVCVLRQANVEVPTDYINLIIEPLDNWRTVLPKELRATGLL